MSTRMKICDGALYESDWGSWKPSSLEMKFMFETLNFTPPTASDLKKFETAASNISINGKSTAWCGLFACFVLKRYGNLDVRWVWGKGIVGSGVNKVWDHRNIKPGDVAVIQGKKNKNGYYLHHHFVVTHVDEAANIMHSVDGNSVGNQIVWHTNKKVFYSGAEKAEKQPYCYYSVVG